MSTHANGSGGPSHPKLLSELRACNRRFDPAHPGAVEGARSAIGWRITDAELAELFGASFDVDASAGVRAREPAVLLSFEAPCLDVEVEILPTGRGRRILGQLAPAQSRIVELRHPGGTITLDADEVGRFAVDEVEPGPVSLRCKPSEGSDDPVVETDWFLA